VQSPQWQLRADRKPPSPLLGKAHLTDHATGKGLIGAVPAVVAAGLCTLVVSPGGFVSTPLPVTIAYPDLLVVKA